MNKLILMLALVLLSCERDSIYACSDACKRAGGMIRYSQTEGCICLQSDGGK